MSLDTTIQLRHLFEIVSGATPESGNADYWDGDIAWVTPEDVSQVEGNVLRDTRRKLTAEGYANSGTKMASAGGIVLTKRAPIGQLALLGLDACSNQGCFLLSAREGIEPRFFYYVLANNVPLLQALGRGSTFMELSTDDLKALRVPVLDYARQIAIADYLDAAVAHVDDLLHSKLGVLDLLAEKRKAVIATAVTHGLDPKVKVRDSGVPWLGEIPAHWGVSRLKFEATHIVDCLHATPPYEADGEFPAIRTADVEPGLLLLRQARRLRAEDYRRWTERLAPIEGDILYTREGERFGIAANVPADVQLCISQRMMVFRIRPDRDSTYFMWQLNSPSVYQQASEDQLGAAAPHINVDRIQNFWLLVPPLNEQQAIVGHIGREAAKLDAIRSATERTIALLKERRAALIAAAVTGQLDVGAAA